MAGGTVSAEQLRLICERWERLQEEKRAIADDQKDVMAEAKGAGFDVKTIRRVLKARAMERDARMEQDALYETYAAALGLI